MTAILSSATLKSDVHPLNICDPSPLLISAPKASRDFFSRPVACVGRRLASLRPCVGLTELDLACGFHSAHVSTLLAKLTELKKFKLWGALETLQCFASGPATRTFQSLSLCQFSLLLPSELVHHHALKGLRSLDLSNVIDPLGDATLNSLCPPSAIFPRLTMLECLGGAGEAKASGSSFEWMQLRLTQ